MEPFVTHRGRLAVLDWSDVNTDLIIPARYLKKVERTGFGPLLFADKRYAPGGAPEADDPDQHGPELPEFPAQQPGLQGRDRAGGRPQLRLRLEPRARRLGRHAGRLSAPSSPRARARDSPTSSSRTRFRTDCWSIELDQTDWESIAAAGRDHPRTAEVTIDLRDQTVKLHLSDAGSGDSPETRFRLRGPRIAPPSLASGLDAIAETLDHEPEITRYEQHAPAWLLAGQEWV